MTTPASGVRDFFQVYFTDQFDARKYISEQVGEDNMPAFELWAFKANAPMQYDESARFLWNLHHRSCPLIGSYKTCIMRIVDYWQERFKVND